MRRRRVTLAFAFAVLLVAGGALIDGAFGQFQDETTVVVVEVPVHVLRDGEPMRDLTADDFEVLDGRKKQQIIGFEMIDLGEFGAAPEQKRVTEIPASGRRHFLLLFDLSLSDPESIIRARQSARRLIWEGLHPADLVAVATYSEYNGVRMVLNFTPNREQVEVAIKTLGLAEPASRIHDPLSILIGDLGAEGGDDGPGGGGGQIPDVIAETARDLKTMAGRITRDQQKNRVMALTGSLSNLAQLMNAVDGRKHVVFLSEGFDGEILVGTEDIQRQTEIQAALAAGETWQSDATERYGDTQAASAIQRMVDEFRRADCAIQAVNIGGIEAGPDADTRGTRNEGLFRMARETGGEFYQNYNEIDQAMVEVLDRTSVTYILAFQPKNLEFDGKFHKLRVKLRNQPKGVRLVHRPGYYPPKPFSQQSGVERQLATASEVLAGSVGGSFLTSVLSAAFPAPTGASYVPVLIEVDGPSLLAGHSGETLVTELYAYALDSDGQVRDFFVRKLGLDAASSRQALMGGGFKYGGHLDLEPGDYVVRTLVRNGMTGESSLSETSVKVPDEGAGESVLLPPFFPEAPGKWVFGRESEEEQRTDVDYPFVLGEELFMPAAKPVLDPNGSTIGIPGYNLGSGSLSLSVQLFDTAGSPLSGGEIDLVERAPTSSPGFEWLIATFAPGQLRPGEYLMVVTVSDLAGGEELTSSTPVVVTG